MSAQEQAEALRDLRKTLDAVVENVDPNHFVTLRADIDRSLAAIREAGFGPEQAGALLMYRLSSVEGTPIMLAMELIAPGWNDLVFLAVVMQVLDDGEP